MKVHEYQAKQIISGHGALTPRGGVASSFEEAASVRDSLGTKVCVVKAQIHAGGRGKGGGVRVCKSEKEFEEAVRAILGMNLVTPQTSPEGQRVRRVLIEEGMDIRKELYFSILADRVSKKPAIVCSSEGGMDIEEVAERSPEKIITETVPPLIGLRPYQAARIAYKLGLDEFGKEPFKKAIAFFGKLYEAYMSEDASLLEINPLVITGSGEMIALDCKMAIDDNALFRHKNFADYRDLDEEDPSETKAAEYDLNFIKLDGNIGCMVNGAGLAMATMDTVKHCGGFPANFLDVGGGATQERVEAAFRIITEDPRVSSILINIFGGIVRCDMIAKALVSAVKSTGIAVPVVARLKGTNSAEALEIIGGSDVSDKLMINNDLKEAAALAVRLSR